MDPFEGMRDRIDFRVNARTEYEARVASRDTVLDVGGRNQRSLSNKRLRELSTNPRTKIISTDIIAEYGPDIVDDICNSRIESGRFDAVYCDAILEHVRDDVAAVNHIHRILKPGGELFLYVPFFWSFHDRMDYHRFTFSEIDRLLGGFSEHKLFRADGRGYGGVLWQVLTLYKIEKLPALFDFLARCTNAALAIPLTVQFALAPHRGDRRDMPFGDFRRFYTHFYISHGFCAWARK
jgi:SAM-dependent methyltransferase